MNGADIAEHNPRNSFLDRVLWSTKYGNFTVENIPYFLLHLSPIAALFVPFTWDLVMLCAALYFARMFAITGFYHRYFSHRGYRVPSRFVQFLMAFWGCTALQQGPLWWANHHRYHHRHSDTEKDLHSPARSGFLYSHTLWFLFLKHHSEFAGHTQEHDAPKDLARFPELRWLDRFHIVPPVILAVVLFWIGGRTYVVWGFGISTVLLYHGTFTINSLSHMYGRRRFDTNDTSRNNFWLAMITLGEGWHNNHHAFCGGAQAGFYARELDVTYLGLRLLAFFGLVRDLGAPPKRLLARGRRADRLRKRLHGYVRKGVASRLSVREIQLLLEAGNCCVERAVMRRLPLADLRDLIERYRRTKERLLRIEANAPVMG